MNKTNLNNWNSRSGDFRGRLDGILEPGRNDRSDEFISEDGRRRGWRDWIRVSIVFILQESHSREA